MLSELDVLRCHAQETADSASAECPHFQWAADGASVAGKRVTADAARSARAVLQRGEAGRARADADVALEAIQQSEVSPRAAALKVAMRVGQVADVVDGYERPSRWQQQHAQ